MAIAPNHAAETPENHRRRPLIGYVGVSTEKQGTDPQCDELRAAVCAIPIHTDTPSPGAVMQVCTLA